MKSKNWTILAVVMSVVFFVAALVAFLLGPCQTMVDYNGVAEHMKCYWAFRAASFVMVGAVVMGVIAATRKSKDGRVMATFAAILFAAMSAFLLSPEGIGICDGENMICNVHDVPFYILALIGIVIGIVAAVKASPKDAE